MREISQHIEFVDALAAQQIDGLRALGLKKRREHLTGVDLFSSGALRVKLGVLHDALQHRREHRLHFGIVGKLLERSIHEVVELLLEGLDIAATFANCF